MHYFTKLSDQISCIANRTSEPTTRIFLEEFCSNLDETENLNTSRFLVALRTAIQLHKTPYLLVVRNPNLILDADCRRRMIEWSDELQNNSREIALYSPGGVSLTGEKFCSSYASEEPFILPKNYQYPIVDTMIDAYVLRTDILDDYLKHLPTDAETFFETGFILHAYLLGKPAIYEPRLSCAINGTFLSRDATKFINEAQSIYPQGTEVRIQSLMGEFTLWGNDTAPTHAAKDRPNPYASINQQLLVKRTLAHYRQRTSLSIITRTQFNRMHLLRRLLASATRATVRDIEMEILLCSDAPSNVAASAFDLLRLEFPSLNIRLVESNGQRPSRVRNLLSGITAANGDFCWMIDDDDYLDILSLRNVSEALFPGITPCLCVASQCHQERWSSVDTDHPILSLSTPSNRWEPSGWRTLATGINSVPICGVIIPTLFLQKCVSSLKFDHDLSEDYTIFLRLFSHPDVPPIIECSFVGCHISIRAGSDNSVTAPDRTQWTRDIHGHLFDLLYSETTKSMGAWQVFSAQFQNRAAASGSIPLADVARLKQEKDQQIKLLELSLARTRDELKNLRGQYET